MTDRDHLRDVLARLLTECVQEHKSLLDDATHYISEDLADAEWGALADHAADAVHHAAMVDAFEHALNLVRHAAPHGEASMGGDLVATPVAHIDPGPWDYNDLHGWRRFWGQVDTAIRYHDAWALLAYSPNGDVTIVDVTGDWHDRLHALNARRVVVARFDQQAAERLDVSHLGGASDE